MKKIYTIILFSTIYLPLQAQTLEYPQKNCQGASVTPEGLYSWCNDNVDEYYNECDCRYEKALKEYEARKEQLENQLRNLSSEK